MSEKKRLFFPNLDGLRFICFFLIFFYHSCYTTYSYISDSHPYHFVKSFLFRNGNLGVNFFFVLSGFLITYLLMEEDRERGKIDIVSFWIRRILRIWPLYFFCVFFGFFIFPVLKRAFGQVPDESATLIHYLTFTSNFEIIKKGLPDASILGVLWSISVEEQFYLVWPIFLAFIPRRFYPWFFSLVLVITYIFRSFHMGTSDTEFMTLEVHPLSCIGDMVIGAFGAYFMTFSNWKTRIETLDRKFIAGIYLAFIAILFYRAEIFYSFPVIGIFERSIISVVILFIILEQNYARNSFFKMSNFKYITKLGVITYGLYCLHLIAILTVITLTRVLGINKHIWQVLIMEPVLSFILTIIIAQLSYKYFETPFLRLKNKFAYIKSRVPAGAAKSEAKLQSGSSVVESGN